MMIKRFLSVLFAGVLMGCAEGGDNALEQLNVGEGSVAIITDVEGIIVQSETRAASEPFEIPADLLPTYDELNSYEMYLTGTYYDPDDLTTPYTYEETYSSIAAYNTAGTSLEGTSLIIPPYLPAGDYTATITDKRDRTAEGEGREYCCYSGSMDFTIIARKYDLEQTVTAKLENSLVSLEVTEDFEKYFTSSTLYVESEKGTKFMEEYPLSADAEARYLSVAADTNLYLWGSATKQDPGTGSPAVVSFTKCLIGTATGGELTTVIVDAASAATFTVTVTIDKTITELPVVSVDLNGDDE